MKIPFVLLAGAAATLAGTAFAATANRHVMNVPLPDGTIAQIQYVGDVPPKVTLAPNPRDAWTVGLPSLANFDGMFEQMNRQMREMREKAWRPGGVPGMNIASYGNLPAGTNSVSVVSFSNGGGTCTRTTEVVSQGTSKPPKVTTSVSGDCGESAGPAPSEGSDKPVTRT